MSSVTPPLDQVNGSGDEEVAPAPTIIHSCYRTGCMAAFESFAQFESYFDEILDLVEDCSSTSTVSAKILESVGESGSESHGTSINVSLSTDAPPRLSHDDQHNIQVKEKLINIFGHDLIYHVVLPILF